MERKHRYVMLSPAVRGRQLGDSFSKVTRTLGLDLIAAVVRAIPAMVVLVGVAEMAVSVGWVAVSWVADASVIGDVSLGGARVSANDADERVRAVGIATACAHRICADG